MFLQGHMALVLRTPFQSRGCRCEREGMGVHELVDYNNVLHEDDIEIIKPS